MREAKLAFHQTWNIKAILIGMADLDLLHKSARSLILRLRAGLDKLERAEQIHDQTKASTLSQDLQGKLLELQKLSQELDSVYRIQSLSSSNVKTTLWRKKVEQVSDEEQHLREALERHGMRQQRRQVEDTERRELLENGTRDGGSHDPFGDSQREQNYVQNSKRLVEEMLDNGATILVDMSGQRERLKSAHRKMLDTLNSIGLSDSLMRVIDRRQTFDKLLVYGGMVFILIFIGILIWWRRS